MPTMTTPTTTPMTLPDAALHLRLTRRTVERMLADGRLHGHKRDGRWIVEVPTDAEPLPTMQASAADHAALLTERDQLRAERAALVAERDALQVRLRDAETTIARLTAERDSAVGERDWLRQTLSATLARTLPEPATSSPRTRWRWPWR
jgi:hypothetical protein